MPSDPPALIADADWSKDAGKRWIAIAHLRGTQYQLIQM